MLDQIKMAPINIEILDISPKNKTMLELFFKSGGKALFKKSDTENASAFIIDYDFPRAKDTWKRTYEETLKPFIIFSSLGIELPSAVSITKPITAQKLLDAGYELQEILQSREVVAPDSDYVILQQNSTTELGTHNGNEDTLKQENEFPELSLESELDDLLDELSLTEEPSLSFKDFTESEADHALKLPPIDLPDNTSDSSSETIAKENTVDKEATIVDKPVIHEPSNNKPSDNKPTETIATEAPMQVTQSDKKSTADSLKESTTVKIELTSLDKRWELLCGTHKDIATPEEVKQIHTNNDLILSKAKAILFDSDEYILSDFLLGIKQSKDHSQIIEMTFPNRTMVIDHKTQSVHCNHTIYSESYSMFCLEPLNKGSFKLRVIEDENEIAESNPNTSYSMESFIWTTSLLTAQGRLPKHCNILNQFTLKQLPDFTHLEQIPHAVRIASVLHKHPSNLLEVATELNISQRYVFSFYNAVLALGLIEIYEPS